MDLRTSVRGYRQYVLSPRTASRALGARRSRSRRDVRQGRMFVPHGFAGANRRRPGSTCKAACSSTPAATVLPAAAPPQLAQSFTQVCWRAPGRPLSTLKVASTKGAAGRGVSTLKVWGPRCLVSALVAPSGVFKGGLRWADGGSHRLAVPGRGRRLLAGVLTGSSVTPTRSKRLDDARCWTQRRPPAGSSR